MTRSEIMDKNYTWYLAHRKELYKKYPEKFLVIANEKVEWCFDTLDEAYSFWISKFTLWYFLLQKCESNIPVLNLYWVY